MEVKQIKIDGMEFKISAFPAVDAFKLKVKLSRILSPIIGSFIGGFLDGNKKEISSFADAKITGEAIMLVFQNLSTTLDPDNFFTLIKEILFNTGVIIEGEEKDNKQFVMFSANFNIIIKPC